METQLGQRLVEMASGEVVERDALRIAEKINEYDSNLILRYCSTPDLTDAPYRLVEKCPDGFERIVFDIWELDDRVLERVRQADNARHAVATDIESANEIARKAQKRRYEELSLEAKEISTSVIKSPKETYKFVEPFSGKKLKIHQHRPVEAEEG